MIERAVGQLRGQPAEPEFATTLQLGLDIRIPSSYIAQEHQRLRVYKRIAAIRNAADRSGVEQELLDRYGPLPVPVRNLLEYADLKALAEKLWIQSIERKADSLDLQFHAQAVVNTDRLLECITERPGVQFTPAGLLRIPWRQSVQEFLPQLRGFLERLQA